MNKTPARHRRVLLVTLAVVSGMFGFGFALVPIYNIMADAMGFNGRVAQKTSVADREGNQTLTAGQIDKSRLVTLQFVVTDNPALSLEFRPLINQVRVNPGEVKEVAYYVKNLSDKEMVVQAIPGVLPGTAASYLKWLVSLDKERLGPGEAKTLPLKVVVTSALPKRIEIITLSYRLIGVTSSADANESRLQLTGLFKESV